LLQLYSFIRLSEGHTVELGAAQRLR
jgi:hypothetical protein